MRTMASFGEDGFVRLGQPAIACQPFAKAHAVNSSWVMPVLTPGAALLRAASRSRNSAREASGAQNRTGGRPTMACSISISVCASTTEAAGSLGQDIVRLVGYHEDARSWPSRAL